VDQKETYRVHILEFLLPKSQQMGISYDDRWRRERKGKIPLFPDATCHDDTFQLLDAFILHRRLEQNDCIRGTTGAVPRVKSLLRWMKTPLPSALPFSTHLISLHLHNRSIRLTFGFVSTASFFLTTFFGFTSDISSSESLFIVAEDTGFCFIVNICSLVIQGTWLTFPFPFELSDFLIFFGFTSESSSESLITAAEEIGF
jgi:hypothetical protein